MAGMEELRHVPLFRGFSNIELAKLVPMVEICHFPAGSVVNPSSGEDEGVYFLVRGSAELVSAPDASGVPLATLSQGDPVGPWLPNAPPLTEYLRATSDLTLIRFRKESFHALCRSHSAVMNEMGRWAFAQAALGRDELVRTKRMLAVYAAELWYAQDGGEPTDEHESAAAAEAPLEPLPALDEYVPMRPAQRTDGARWQISRQALLRIAAIGSLVGLDVWATVSGASAATLVLALLGWGAVNWFLNVIPDYAVALAMVASAAALHVAPLPTVLSGFTNSAYFLLLGIYGMGAAIQRTGLLYRFALFMLRMLPPTYGGQTLALSLTGLMLTPVLPSANGRVTIASPLVRELAEAMRIQPRSSASSGLLLSALHGFGQMFFLFMSGGTCLVLWGLLPEPYRAQVTWLRWTVVALPLGIIMFFGFLALLYLIPGARSIRPISRQILDTQLATLGPLSKMELVTLVVTGIVFLLITTQPLHHIDAAWPSVIGLVLLLTVGIVDRAAFLQKIDWTYLAFFGAVVGFADVIRYVHLDRSLGQVAQVLLGPTMWSPALFLGAIVVLTYLVRVVVPWSASVPLIMLAITPVMLQGHYHPFIGGLTLLAASNPFILPNQNLLFLSAHTGTDEQAITLPMAARYGWIHAGLVLVAVVMSVPIWSYFGWTP